MGGLIIVLVGMYMAFGLALFGVVTVAAIAAAYIGRKRLITGAGVSWSDAPKEKNP